MNTKIKFFAAFVAVALFSAFTFVAQAPKWNVDTAHSSITFAVKHLFTPTKGSFDTYKTDLNFAPDDLANSSVSIEIDVNSINTGNAKRDGHLKTKDFFDTASYDKITFKSTTFKKVGDNKFEAKGKLTMKDVTKDVTIPFTLLGIKNVKDQTVAGLSGEFKLNRNDYGVGTGSFAATATIGDEVTVNVEMAVQKPM